MKNLIYVVAIFFLFVSTAGAQTVAEITHSEFQEVDASGEQLYNMTEKVILEGILLNNPSDMLDPRPDDSITDLFNLGGQWQFFFQGEGQDNAGTVVYFAQLYDNLPWVLGGGYSNEEFVSELNRLNDVQFGIGDRIRVTGYYLSYNGKNNINEQHNKNSDHDFTVELLDKGAGLPRPEVVTLDNLKDSEDEFIFDPERLVGCEYYQGRLIKIEDVYFLDPNSADDNWEPNGEFLVTDGFKTFPVKLGRGNGIYAGSNNLTEPFDIIGIMDQESTEKDADYRLYVMDYDGNGGVLAQREHRRADKPGDINLDGTADYDDFLLLIEDWLE
ncbi:hypothetical protein ACFLZ8_00245 [Planctomycetota bacterium]